MPRFDCADVAERARGIGRAIAAVDRHQLVVIPTESTYAVACNAFSPVGIERLNEAKGRLGRDALPVMVGSIKAARAILGTLHPQGEALIEGFWPGPLTAWCPQQSTLTWDIGGDGRNVAVRMPLHPVALEVLQGAGPMVVVAANRVGEPAPTNCDDAQEQLGGAVTIYLDAGSRPSGVASTVVDLTAPDPVLLREGAFSIDELRAAAPNLRSADDPVPDGADEPGDPGDPDDPHESVPNNG